ncbi:MFS transporter [Variovorax sp. J22R133]|uniref:MFS transporter n=1 Tax=Variovorax brevis TaxID=3053503 RepID=UPI0025750326|nr:MFS transporter [Variovorax sp. J22R133]MDM0117386.1 MFS transporter [Variovorax sp. J22R133]
MPNASKDSNILRAVICGGLIMGVALGARHVQGLFLVPMTIDRGWSREAFGLAIAMQNLVWGFAQPFTGMLADRFGSVRVIALGTLLYLVGLVLMSLSVTPTQLTLSAGLLIGVALSCTAFGTVYGAISRIAEPSRRSWALGITGAVGGLGQFVMVPVTQGLQHWLGWAAALVVLGMTIGVLGPLALTLNDRASTSTTAAPTARSQSIRQAVREAFRHRGFWLLNAGFVACGFQLAFIGTHLPAYLLGKGLSANDAVAGLAIIALANTVGTFVCGYLGDFFRRKYLLSAIYLARSVAMAAFFLLPLSVPSLHVFCAVMGLLWLGTVPLTSGLIAQVFGVQYIATLFGFVFFGHQVGSFLGVWLAAHVFDATKSYDLIWIGSIALGLMAAALHWPINDRQVQRGVVPAGAMA